MGPVVTHSSPALDPERRPHRPSGTVGVPGVTVTPAQDSPAPDAPDPADLARQARRLSAWARIVLVPVAVIGAVLSYKSLYTAALPTFGPYLAGGFPLLVDLLILGASLQYVAGAKVGRPMTGWRLTAHCGVAGTLILNALAAQELGEVPWHVTAPAVWAVLVELTGKQVLGQWKATHTGPAASIAPSLWLSAPIESIRTRLLMARTGLRDSHAARIGVGTAAAAREALNLSLPRRVSPRRDARRVRRVVNRQLRAGSLPPSAVMDAVGWTSPEQQPVRSPETILRAVVQTILRPDEHLSPDSTAIATSPAAAAPGLPEDTDDLWEDLERAQSAATTESMPPAPGTDGSSEVGIAPAVAPGSSSAASSGVTPEAVAHPAPASAPPAGAATQDGTPDEFYAPDESVRAARVVDPVSMPQTMPTSNGQETVPTPGASAAAPSTERASTSARMSAPGSSGGPVAPTPRPVRRPGSGRGEPVWSAASAISADRAASASPARQILGLPTTPQPVDEQATAPASTGTSGRATSMRAPAPAPMAPPTWAPGQVPVATGQIPVATTSGNAQHRVVESGQPRPTRPYNPTPAVPARTGSGELSAPVQELGGYDDPETLPEGITAPALRGRPTAKQKEERLTIAVRIVRARSSITAAELRAELAKEGWEVSDRTAARILGEARSTPALRAVQD